MERPPGCTHDDCHRSYNQRVAAALGPLHHQASGGSVAPHGHLPPPPPPAAAPGMSAYPYGYGARPPVQAYGPHVARNLASNPSSMPSSREHSPRFSPHDSNMSEDYGSDPEHAAACEEGGRRAKGGMPAPLLLPQPRLPASGNTGGPPAHAHGALPEWTPSSSPVLGPLKSMSLFSHTVPNSPFASRPGSPVRGHRLSPPDSRGTLGANGAGSASTSPIQHHAQHPSATAAGALHIAGQGHHPSHRHRSHPYGGAAISESRSHHHLSSLAHAPHAQSNSAVGESTVPHEASTTSRPSLSRNNSSAFGSSAKSSSSLSLSAYHLSGPVSTPDPRRLAKDGGRIASDSMTGARSAGASRVHLPSFATENGHGRDPSRQLPSIFGHHHPSPLHSVTDGHHQHSHAHSFHPYGNASQGPTYRETKRSASRSAPASRATSPFTSPSAHHAHAHPVASGNSSASHSRQSSSHHLPSPPVEHRQRRSVESLSPPTTFSRAGYASVQHSPSSAHMQPPSRQASPSSSVLPPLHRGGSAAANSGSNGSKHGSNKNIFAMTPIHSMASPPTLPPISSLDPPATRVHHHHDQVDSMEMSA